MPWLFDWDSAGVDADLRKTFAVALHAGTAAALVIARSRDVTLRDLPLMALSAGPPAVAGYLLERSVERYLGTPATIAGGLVAGALAMAVADRAPERRRCEDATAADALWLGGAQAIALLPGVSRAGATLAAARLRAFRPPDAHRLSRQVALPVIAGAALLKAVRAHERGLDRSARASFGAGAGAAFISALGSIRLLERDGPLWPYAAYRVALAAAIVRRLRGLTSARSPTMRL